MDSILGRYRNITILAAVMIAQVVGLASQVKRTGENGSTLLIRTWAVSVVAPFEKAIVWSRTGTFGLWHNYFYLRGVRQENRDLKATIEKMNLEQVRLKQDADQANRLQSLLGFKEQFISKTLAAQVIGTSGSELSRTVYIDKACQDGIGGDMPVITGEGVVGKVLRCSRGASPVLLINDQTSGVGVILEKSRLQGILRGTASGEVVLEKIMNDEPVQAGEAVLTSGGDQIYPKGLAVGVVSKVAHGPEAFLQIRVKPAANLSKLEEVLVIIQKEDKVPAMAEGPAVRAVDILAERLPSVPEKPENTLPSKSEDKAGEAPSPSKPKSAASPSAKENPSKTISESALLNKPANAASGASIKKTAAASKTAGSPTASSAETKAAEEAQPESLVSPVVPKPKQSDPSDPQ